MENTLIDLLKKHWGYDTLRPEQEEIIAAVLEGKDVLALLPTGGGKSLCFQLPALYRPGLALIISPLIALMQEQVADLQKRKIAAAAIFATLPRSEVEWTLEQAAANHLKCLYLSPERLSQTAFVERLSQLPVNLLAVDEAHCVSVWGQDFRPAYGRIGSLHKHFAAAPILALTATATPQAQAEIISALKMRTPLLVRRSLQRHNLSYSAFCTEKKGQKLQEILSAISGPALIYVPTRQGSQQWAKSLQKAGLQAAYYHAGLSTWRRRGLQQRWMQNKLRILVATSAFGMGINKEDLALVVHMYVPESLAAYYQEAGRAGRAGQKAYAVLLYSQEDLARAQALAAHRVPDETHTRRVYQALGNYYKVAVGSGAYYSHSFDFEHFIHTYRLPRRATYYALQRLLCEEQIQLIQEGYKATQVRMLVDKVTLYRAEIARPALAMVMQVLLRCWGGRLYTERCTIDESALAYKVGISRKRIREELLYAHKAQLLQYLPPSDGPQLIFLESRIDATLLRLNTKVMQDRKEALLLSHEAVSNYLEVSISCREQALLRYFGEASSPCNRCDRCTRSRIEKKDISTGGS